MILLAIMPMMFIVSCSNDDNNNDAAYENAKNELENIQSLIIGNKFVEYEFWSDLNQAVYKSSDYYRDNRYYEFKRNGVLEVTGDKFDFFYGENTYNIYIDKEDNYEIKMSITDASSTTIERNIKRYDNVVGFKMCIYSQTDTGYKLMP